MNILTSRVVELVSGLIDSTPGGVARRVEQATADLSREFKQAVLQEMIWLALEEALGPKRQPAESTDTPWPCQRCGPRAGNQLRRNGTYLRSPLTRDGPIRLRIPQLLCRECSKAVPFSLPCLPRFRRLWLDVEHAIAQAYLLGQSYRAVASQVVENTRLSLMTTWRSFQRVGQAEHKLPATPDLTAVGLDEFHIRIHGKANWYLVARGKTKAGPGYYLGAALSEDRSQAGWEQLIDQLGLRAQPAEVTFIADGDKAIEAAVAQCLGGRQIQRCAWHVLHNAWAWLNERLPGVDHEGERRGLLAGAQAVVNAPTASRRRASLKLLKEACPWFGEALARPLTRVGYPNQDAPRTNNVCERGFREWRRRIRPMDGFGSEQGARNFGMLWMIKENARASGKNWMEAIMP